MLDFIEELMQSENPEKLRFHDLHRSEPLHSIFSKVTPAFDYFQDVCSCLWFLI